MSRNLYEDVTNRIIAALENGATAEGWSRPWHIADGGLPVNAVSGRPYRGVNVLTLWAQQMSAGHSSGRWATYKQWQSVGAQVRRGERGTSIVFWQFKDRPAPEDGEETAPGKIAFARAYTVFCADQVDGYTAPTIDRPSEVERVERADAIIRASGATILENGSRAFYSPSRDVIEMPRAELFHATAHGTATEAYYGVELHELTHWTAHPSRLDRDLSGRFGNEAYAAEELIAELGAAFLCASVGIEAEPRADHAQYIASWLGVLRNDPRAIFTAASKAQAAADYLVQMAEAAARPLAA